jgi:hypothetical protein
MILARSDAGIDAANVLNLFERKRIIARSVVHIEWLVSKPEQRDQLSPSIRNKCRRHFYAAIRSNRNGCND